MNGIELLPGEAERADGLCDRCHNPALISVPVSVLTATPPMTEPWLSIKDRLDQADLDELKKLANWGVGEPEDDAPAIERGND